MVVAESATTAREPRALPGQRHRSGLTKALYDEVGRLKGKKRGKAGYVSADTKNSDWYCTNRPQISVNANVPSQQTKGAKSRTEHPTIHLARW
jgi:hypothetical protein